jgi:hypothetical protein
LTTLMKAELTAEGVTNLLACLDADRERAGEKYEQLRRILTRFFLNGAALPFQKSRPIRFSIGLHKN